MKAAAAGAPKDVAVGQFVLTRQKTSDDQHNPPERLGARPELPEAGKQRMLVVIGNDGS